MVDILMSDLEWEIKRIIAQQFDTEGDLLSTEHTLVNDIGADSLDIVELVMTLEDNYDIDIPDDEAQELETVGDIIEYISEQV
tara:strand:+ start:882 stop:1130 length:249 start_codon:yes stop_codon:yes gene_type:complete